MIRRDPDAIVLIAMGNVNITEKKTWGSYTSLKAAKNGNIFFTDDTAFTDPSPESVAVAAEKLAAILSGVARAK